MHIWPGNGGKKSTDKHGLRKSRHGITHYKGIALSCLSKIFQNGIISNPYYASLLTNDLQFAYKSNPSPIYCVNSIFKTANHYVSSAGASHVYMLDASNAFDRVNKP